MSKLFTEDATGLKYEQVTRLGTFHEPTDEICIKPVQKVEETLRCSLWFYNLTSDDKFLVHEDYQFTESQGKAVSEALLALMEYINNAPGKDNDKMYDLRQTARAARTALQGDRG